MTRAKTRAPRIHPVWVRVTHWLNALAIFVMFASGWRIYDASPLFKFIYFPNALTLGAWLGGALLWHFAGMWLLAANFLIYVLIGLASGHFRSRMLPIPGRDLLRDASAALRGELKHRELRHYNAVQKTAYLVAIAGTGLAILSGLALWKPVQLLPLSRLMGGYDVTRVVHFVAMASLGIFIAVHLAMAILVPRSLLAMARGH
jgi:thiosulfate reductase cytochrome b subunit